MKLSRFVARMLHPYRIIRDYTELYGIIFYDIINCRGEAFASLIYATIRITFIRKCFTLPPRDKPDSKYSEGRVKHSDMNIFREVAKVCRPNASPLQTN